MTTIACNKQEIAGDLQYTDMNNASKFKGSPKVYKFEKHKDTYPHCDFYVGFAGTAQDIIVTAEFFSRPHQFDKPPKVKGLIGLVLTEEGEIFTFDSYDKWLKVNEPFGAIGSGQGIAMGAMMAGATPTEAIKIASKKDTYTGMGVKTYKIK
jgi:ATP-dependent protease HslVU (ClpYQ) peptidase subunit